MLGNYSDEYLIDNHQDRSLIETQASNLGIECPRMCVIEFEGQTLHCEWEEKAAGLTSSLPPIPICNRILDCLDDPDRFDIEAVSIVLSVCLSLQNLFVNPGDFFIILILTH